MKTMSIERIYLIFVFIIERSCASIDFETSNSSSESPHELINLDGNVEFEKKIELYHKTDWLLIRYSIFIVVFGVLVNGLNFACFYRMKKRNAQNLYLGALSVAEIFNIIINIAVPLVIRFSRHYPSSVPKIVFNLFSHNRVSEFFCVLYSYLVEICLLVPVWIMVILALERFLSIAWPLRKNMLSTRKQAKRTLIILVTVILSWCTFKLKTAGVEEYSTFKEWGKNGDEEACNRKLSLPTLVNISTVLWAIVPEFLTLLLNLFIIHRIRTTTSLNQRFYSSERTRRIAQATRVVLFLSIIFVLLISPSGVLIIFEFLHRVYRAKDNFDEKVNFELNFMIARKFVLMFYETNMVISFPVYLLTIKNFKEAVKGFLPNLSKLKRKDSSKIGMKDESSHRQRIDMRAKQNSQEPNAERGSRKSVLLLNQNHIDYSGSAPKSSSSSNNMSGNGCNEKCRLTISYRNKTAKFNNFVTNPLDVNVNGAVATATIDNKSNFQNFQKEIFDDFSNSKTLSNRIWSWFSSQNYQNGDVNDEDEQKSLKNNNSN